MIKRTYTPQVLKHELLLTAVEPVSHHDASMSDDSNHNLFNRQAVILNELLEEAPHITVEKATKLSLDHPVPMPIAELVSDLTFPEFLATLIVRQFADEYNGYDGIGLFSGMKRWNQLSKRVVHAAYTDTLRGFWSRLVSNMLMPLPSAKCDHQLLPLLSVPMGTQLAALHVLRTQGAHVVQLARFWHQARKEMSQGYSDKMKDAGMPSLFVTEESKKEQTLTWDESQLASTVTRQRRLEVPHITANSVRHQMVREPAMYEMFSRLGIEPETLEPSVESIFYNGGNIKAGASAPSNANMKAKQMREAFPSLDLLGGVADSFDIGESMLNVRSIIISHETKHLLPQWAQDLPNTRFSAFDLLEGFTFTRQAGTTGKGQMIFGFEGLAAGAQFLITLNLKPYTNNLTRGALVSAVERWQQRPVLGGTSRIGFGTMRIDKWQRTDEDGDNDAKQQYIDYLDGHGEFLKNELMNGTLGAGDVKKGKQDAVLS